MSEEFNDLHAYVVVEEMDPENEDKSYLNTICKNWLIPEEKKFWWPASRLSKRLVNAEPPNEEDYEKYPYEEILFSSGKFLDIIKKLQYK